MALASGRVELAGWYRIDDFPNTETRLGPDLVSYHLGLEDLRGHPRPALLALRFFNRLFGRPTRIFRGQITAPPGSQAILTTFETDRRKIIVVGWLRSSHEDEVVPKSGVLEDQRTEVLSTALPCSEAKLAGYYGPIGNRRKATARLLGGALRNIRIKGGQVFIAEFSCAKK